MAKVLTPPQLYQTTRIKPGSLLAVYREPNSRGDCHIVIDLQKNEAMISQKIPALVARIAIKGAPDSLRDVEADSVRSWEGSPGIEQRMGVVQAAF